MASGSGLVDWFEASVQGSRTLERPNWSCSRATTRGLTCAPLEIHRSAWVPTAQPCESATDADTAIVSPVRLW
jgi:hypothetical protein